MNNPFDKSLKTPIIRIKYASVESEKTKITSSEDIAAIFYAIEDLNDSMEHHEFVYAAYLNTANNVVGVLKISEGAIDHTAVDVRIAMQGALLTNATSMILCHNHPSGSTQASKEDIQITKNIDKAAEIFKIKLLDHLIICKNNYSSMREDGLL